MVLGEFEKVERKVRKSVVICVGWIHFLAVMGRLAARKDLTLRSTKHISATKLLLTFYLRTLLNAIEST